jgi:hypothetical protein
VEVCAWTELTLSSHFPTTALVALLIYYVDWEMLDTATLRLWVNIKIVRVGRLIDVFVDPPMGPDLEIYTQPKGHQENQTVPIPKIITFIISHDSPELSRMICNLDLPLLGTYVRLKKGIPEVTEHSLLLGTWLRKGVRNIANPCTVLLIQENNR